MHSNEENATAAMNVNSHMTSRFAISYITLIVFLSRISVFNAIAAVWCSFDVGHEKQRNANTGWGDGAGRGNGGGGSWKHDQFDGSMKDAGRRMNMVSTKRNDNGMSERNEKPRGVCYAFQRGECNRGDSCKFTHDEQVDFSAPFKFIFYRNELAVIGFNKWFILQNNSGRKAGWNRDEFDGSMKDAGRRMNMGNGVVTSPERRNDKSMKPPADRRRSDDRGKEDGSRRSDGERRRDDGERRRDSDRDDRQRNNDREQDRRVRRDDNREGSYEAKDPESSTFRDSRREERREDRSERRGRDRDGSRKDTERGDDDRYHERSVRSRT